MGFQATVRDKMTNGIIGDVVYDGPLRAKPLVVDSEGVTPNTVGKAFTYLTASDTICRAGSAGGGAFAGILTNSKVYALQGTTAGTLSPTLDLPDNTIGELITMGIIVVDIAVFTTGAIGDGVFYVDATGLLGSGTAGVDQTQIANAKISYHNITAPGIAFITLTEAE